MSNELTEHFLGLYLGIDVFTYESMIWGVEPLNSLKNFSLLEFDEAKWDLQIYMLQQYAAYEDMY